MDEKAWKPILDWLGGNWGWVIAALGVFFEITPIKIHPVTSLLGWIGKKLTGDIRKDIADLRDDVSDLREDVDEQRMSDIRTLVLDFSNSILNGRKHTKEEFDHVLEENKKYEKLVKKYTIDNDVYKEAIGYVKRCYRKRLDKRDFLLTPEPDPHDPPIDDDDEE